MKIIKHETYFSLPDIHSVQNTFPLSAVIQTVNTARTTIICEKVNSFNGTFCSL